MKPVRIYLSFLSQGEWNHIVYREIRALREAWASRHLTEIWSVCAIHIGHDRPQYDISEFESAMAMQNKPVLATEAAKWALPVNLSDCSEASVGFCHMDGKEQPCSLYLMLSAWGYQLDGSNLKSKSKATLLTLSQYEPHGWVKNFIDQNPNTKSLLQAADIYDELSYVKNVGQLNEEICNKAGNYRFEFYRSENNDDNPLPRRSPPLICRINWRPS